MLRKTRQQVMTVELLETRTLLAADITFAEPLLTPIQKSPASVLAVDVNNDQILDVVIGHWNSNSACSGPCPISVHLGNGDGTFQSREEFDIGSLTAHLTAGDFDTDGDLDLAVTGFLGGEVSVLLNKGVTNGQWEGYAAPRGFTGEGFNIISDDFDGDGDPDLALPNPWTGAVEVLLNNNSANGEWQGFAEKVEYSAGDFPQSMRAGDVDSDGDLDLVASNYFGGDVSVFLGNGNGQFDDQIVSPVGDRGLNHPGLGDLDGDGSLDIITPYFNGNILNDGTESFAFLRGNKDGTFSEPEIFPAPARISNVVITDLDNDGDLDLVARFAQRPGDIYILANNGEGVFEEQDGPLSAAGADQRAVITSDVNGDGLQDLIVAGDRSTRKLYVLLNTTEPENSPAPGDANGDGIFNSSDLVAVFQAGEYEDQILANSTFEEGDWNGDGEFDSGDLVLAFQAGHYVSAVTPVMSQRIFAMDTKKPSNLEKDDNPFDNDEDDLWLLTGVYSVGRWYW